MAYALEKLKRKLALPASLVIELPPPEVETDLAIPSFQQSPEAIAKKIRGLREPLIEKAVVTGRYVNLTLDKRLLARAVLSEINKLGNKYGHQPPRRKKIILEYSSPNIAKPLHIGHLRNTVIGQALGNIYRASGYQVTTENWLGDWGKQYGLVILAYQKWGRGKEFKKKPTQHLFKLYVKAIAQAKKDPKIDDQAREIFRKIENGDKKLLRIWQRFRRASISDFKKTYKIINAKFDIWSGESFYVPFIPQTIQEALQKKAAIKDPTGPVVVDLNKYGLRSYLLVKGDGASLYSARDLATAIYRLKKYQPEKLIYVIGNEQEFYFRQLFKTLELMGYQKSKLARVVYGIVTQKGSKMSTRVGNVTTMEEILKEAVKKASDPKIGIGAVRYNLLSQSNEKNVSFDWQRILNLQGNSAPYIQYGYIRTQSILKKAGQRPQQKIRMSDIDKLSPSEEKLVKLLALFPEMVNKSCQLNQPHFVATYLNNLVQEFSRFYNEVPVIKSEGATRNFRLTLVAAVGRVIKNGLALLEIEMPRKM
jgi:arginyl-tRNA synthetase